MPWYHSLKSSKVVGWEKKEGRELQKDCCYFISYTNYTHKTTAFPKVYLKKKAIHFQICCMDRGPRIRHKKLAAQLNARSKRYVMLFSL